MNRNDAAERAYSQLEAWGRSRDWLGADPYEGLNARAARLLTLGGRPLARRLLIQAVKTSPLDLRPLLGIRPQRNAKAVALVAAGYVRGGRGADSLRWLEELGAMNAVSDADGAAWGYHFPFQSRVFFYPRGIPNTIATVFAAHALLDAAETLGSDSALALAQRARSFLVREMWVDRGNGGYFRYVPGEDVLIHNANALALSAVARCAAVAGDEMPEQSGTALASLIAAQAADGSWPYGDAPGLEWIDHYHTGYVLEALEYARRAGLDCAEPLRRGFEFYERHLFAADGVTPLFAVGRPLPLDTHCLAQAIETRVAAASCDPTALDRAVASAAHAARVAAKADGSYVFERRRLWTNRTPLIRWSNAPMFRALGSLLQALHTGG